MGNIWVRVVLFVVIITVVTALFLIGSRLARKREVGEDPMGDFVIKGSKLPLIGGVFCVVVGVAWCVVMPLWSMYGSVQEPLSTIIGLVVFGLVIIAMGALFILYWRKWDMRVADGVLSHRRMFYKGMSIPLTSIKRWHVGRGTFGYEGLFVFDHTDTMVLSIRNTLQGFGLLQQRLQVMAPVEALSSLVAPTSAAGQPAPQAWQPPQAPQAPPTTPYV